MRIIWTSSPKIGFYSDFCGSRALKGPRTSTGLSGETAGWSGEATRRSGEALRGPGETSGGHRAVTRRPSNTNRPGEASIVGRSREARQFGRWWSPCSGWRADGSNDAGSIPAAAPPRQPSRRAWAGPAPNGSWPGQGPAHQPREHGAKAGQQSVVADAGFIAVRAKNNKLKETWTLYKTGTKKFFRSLLRRM